MDYSGVKAVAYAYADRQDQETLDQYDSFLRIVEAKINRVLSTLKLTNRATIPVDENADRYGLPADFEGMIDLRVNGTNDSGESFTRTVEYRTPSAIQEFKNDQGTDDTDSVFYNIINNELQIVPTQEDGADLEMTYYRRLPELTAQNTSNWVSEDNPDCYVFGVLVEIGAFVKDAATAASWNDRFEGALAEISANDGDVRWDSGNALQIRRI